MGTDISPYVFEDRSNVQLNVEKITTKGKKSDRFDVFSDANPGSDVVAKIPGETEFEKLGEEGTFVQIQLLGGKTGFISKEDLD